jgi:hypothetical protein
MPVASAAGSLARGWFRSIKICDGVRANADHKNSGDFADSDKLLPAMFTKVRGYSEMIMLVMR